jgi:hypothetical protein
MMGNRSTFRNLWRAFIARREAVHRLKPFVEKTVRASFEIAEGQWLTPYVLGFVISAITIVSRNRVDALDDEALALAQIETWERLTGLDGGSVGERILSLSLGNDGEFAQGCADGVSFGRMLASGAYAAFVAVEPRPPASSEFAYAPCENRATLDDLWDRGVTAKLRRI